MQRLDRLLTVLGILMGVCCLLATATTFSAPSWLPLGIRDLMLVWVPLACLLGVLVIGVTLFFPDLFHGTTSRRTIVYVSLMVLGVAVAGVILLRRCLLPGM